MLKSSADLNEPFGESRYHAGWLYAIYGRDNMNKPNKKYDPEVRIYGSVKELMEAAARILEEEAARAVTSNRELYVALPGGDTPRTLYRRLAEEPFRSEISWSRIHFFWSDERCVPPNHPESNFRMVSDTLLSRISIPEKNIHRIRGEARPDEEAGRYGREINQVVPIISGGMPRFSWILLGLGKDGHTASLFPEAAAMHAAKIICATAVHPESGRRRITMTLPLINNAARISFIVSGKDKAEIVSEILNKDSDHRRYPAAMVASKDGLFEWLLDAGAASALQ